MWYLIVLIPDLCHLSYFVDDYVSQGNVLGHIVVGLDPVGISLTHKSVADFNQIVLDITLGHGEE